VIKYFNKVCSFDYADCECFENVKYVPLFYTPDIEQLKDIKREIKYDFFFMGTYIPERYKAVLSLVEYIKTTCYTINVYIYIPITSFIKKQFRRNMLDKSIVSVRHLKRKKYLDILSKSRVVVDVSSASQTGLAMRIIEALALEKKVMTNNDNILKEPFYSYRNILVFNVDNPGVTNEFMSENFFPCGNILSLERWIEKLFET
jgi:hypothetical protein